MTTIYLSSRRKGLSIPTATDGTGLPYLTVFYRDRRILISQTDWNNMRHRLGEKLSIYNRLSRRKRVRFTDILDYRYYKIRRIQPMNRRLRSMVLYENLSWPIGNHEMRINEIILNPQDLKILENSLPTIDKLMSPSPSSSSTCGEKLDLISTRDNAVENQNNQDDASSLINLEGDSAADPMMSGDCIMMGNHVDFDIDTQQVSDVLTDLLLSPEIQSQASTTTTTHQTTPLESNNFYCEI